jgi:uncharacterized membrane protein YozB (DUF420 family)
MTDYFVAATASLFLQLAIIAVLVVGTWFKAKKRFRLHGLLMFLAVGFHSVSIVSLMLPSFFYGLVPYAASFPLEVLSLAVVHGVSGILAWLLSLWIVLGWRLRSSLQYCQPKKKLMRVTFMFWLLSLILGVAVYVIFYMPFLLS